MKEFCFLMCYIVFFLLNQTGIQAQNTRTKLDQLKLVQILVGTWESKINKDSVLISEVQQHEKLLIENVLLVVNGNRTFSYTLPYVYSSTEDRFVGIVLYPSGD
jgi:hypothetical protein